MDIIGKKYIFLSFSGILMLASVVVLLVWGLRLGIDFTGGSLLEVEFLPARPSVAQVVNVLDGLIEGGVTVQPVGERGIIIRMPPVDEAVHQSMLVSLKNLAAENQNGTVVERKFDSIGPTIGKELKSRAIYAVLLAIAGIVLYIAWAFRKVSKPVASWKYGVVTIAALAHDVILPIGAFSFLGRISGVEVDTLFISAVLTILGFSVHDTIVVFDRIRENLRKLKQPEPYAATVNRSINETLTRSINTSFTVLLVLGVILAFGGETTKFFAIALILGIIFGTYSSIFVASPLLVIWENRRSGSKK